MAFNFRAAASRRRQLPKGSSQIGTGIKPTIQRERVSEFGKPQGGNPMKQNAELTGFAGRGAEFKSPLAKGSNIAGAALRKRKVLSDIAAGAPAQRKKFGVG